MNKSDYSVHSSMGEKMLLPFDGRMETKAVTCRPINSIHTITEFIKRKAARSVTIKTRHFNPLTDEQIKRHLSGEQLIGIYPLLLNNTSHFIAADFDGDNWLGEARKFIQACEVSGLPVYLERSRSGNGGHAWLFLSEAYPSFKSRKVFLSILQATGIFSVFDKDSSFDRLFPNQDSLSGKGLGNLIALPLFKKSLDQGNSCFINLSTAEAHSDQWQFLKSIKRIEIIKMRIY